MIKILKYNDVPHSSIFERGNIYSDVCDTVRDILEDVKENGDAALLRYTRKFDAVELSALQVSKAEMDEALSGADSELVSVIREAARNIRRYHEKQTRNSYVANAEEGYITGQLITPIEKVGIYVPGGTAAYPSTVLMDCIPAKIAGCAEIIMVTPPMKNGKVNPNILTAAAIAGVDRIFKVGGAQAIAALAFGTQSIPAVDKIVGPGNAFVAEAKKQVFGKVSIDMIAGPSEILVVADAASDPVYVAADMLSQAEHDKRSSAVLVTDSEALAHQVSAELERQIPLLPRAEIARASIDDNGKIIVAQGDLVKGIEIANEIAPEHLELCVDEPFNYLNLVKNAGSVFMGRYCPEALGDYFAGPNHTLPTSGTAKFSSALGVDDFVKKIQFTYYTRDALKSCAGKVAFFARAEGLEAHARSAEIRFEGDK